MEETLLIKQILISLSTVGGLGIIFGIGLAIASKLLYTERDERIDKLLEVLPGVNCGACGYAGCNAYAKAIIANDNVELNLCSPGGVEIANKLSKITGKEIILSKKKMFAHIHCRGCTGTSTYDFTYKGIMDCNAIYRFYGGNRSCKYGCLNLGSCIKICPVDAISYDKENLVVVNKAKCISCKKCVDVCPTGVIKMIPCNVDYVVNCNSREKGIIVKKYCKVGCIGCKLCAKKSNEGGFIIENFLAHIDYTQQGSREEAVNACPSKCINRI